MKDKKGNVLVPVNGAQVGFRFSTWAINQARKECGYASLSVFWNALSEENTDCVLSLLKEAHNDYEGNQKLDLRGMTDFIDEIGGFINAIELLRNGLEQNNTYDDPNQTAPETGLNETNTHLSNANTSPVLN